MMDISFDCSDIWLFQKDNLVRAMPGMRELMILSGLISWKPNEHTVTNLEESRHSFVVAVIFLRYVLSLTQCLDTKLLCR